MPTVGSSTMRMSTVGGQPLGDAHLLLVAAGEVADALRQRRRAHVELRDERLGAARLHRVGDAARASRRCRARR